MFLPVFRRLHRPTILFCILLLLTTACTSTLLIPPSGGNPSGVVVDSAASAVDAASIPLTGASNPADTPLLDTTCQGFTAPRPTGLQVYQTPNLLEPAAHTFFRDPVFGTCLVRVTDRSSDLARGDPAEGLATLSSGAQAFNADGSLVLVRSAAGHWVVYSTQSFQALTHLVIPGGHDPRWDSANPWRLYYFAGSRLYAYDLQHSQARLLRDFAQDFPARQVTWAGTNGSDSMSRDGRTWGLMVRGPGGVTPALLIYDLASNTIPAHLDLPEETQVRSVNLSPDGAYLLAWYQTDCPPSSAGALCGLVVYDQQMENGRNLLPADVPADTALDGQGHPVLVYQDPGLNSIAMLNLKSGAKTGLWAIDTSQSLPLLSISGRGLRRPGWALVSASNSSAGRNTTWMDNSLFAVELKANGRVARLAHTHAQPPGGAGTSSLTLPQASTNPDLTRLVFTSNWGQPGTGESEVYMVALPPDWMSERP